jgi:hypothetical protein
MVSFRTEKIAFLRRKCKWCLLSPSLSAQAKETHVQCVRRQTIKKAFDGALARAFYSDHLKGAGWVRLFQIINNKRWPE